jgi:hypothetical protein
MTANQKRLRELMAGNKDISSYAKLAGFWGVSTATVHAYLKPETSKSHRAIPDEKLKELEVSLGSSAT